MNEYYTIVTKRGQQKIEEYYQLNKTVTLTQMGFGGVDADDINYVRPNVDATEVPNEWARLGLERHPDAGFIGGGATISNKTPEHQGHWICSVGIYDEDNELILISAYRPMLVDPEASIVASYVINIQTVLSNAENVVVIRDTSVTHPTHDELDAAIESVKKKIPLAASAEDVAASKDEVKFVSPLTLDKKGLIKAIENTLLTVERLYPIGHVLITVNAASPDTYGYPGVWEMQGADMTLLTTQTASDVNKVSGTNTPLVPLLLHTHSASFSGDKLPPHAHPQDERTPLTRPNDGTTDPTSGSPSGSAGGNTGEVSGGTPSGEVSVSNAGVKDATIDVRGRHLTVYMFLRIE
ncbi:phage tail protein [Shewanella sp. D64]|uniref:phage tail-collar fiber domain-containing protein n=1 Tax=unclassified Shewanella TaxID=196818 RepID=UPI0022BA59C6|nr:MULTISPECIES: phage tail protein [unclassified Shewanella]MEC4729013.1 phage tail protein [Shewanella sp. D64]MEC4740039.1 phage tail protein [Shewanella sp. E94]WBJ94394.1 phage tail protein [Shewanella sp. MTB7]